MTAKPDTSVWEELCIFTDNVLHVLCLHKLVATGRATGLVILQEQARWLKLTNLTLILLTRSMSPVQSSEEQIKRWR